MGCQSSKPVTEAPVTEVPGTEVPGTDAPVTLAQLNEALNPIKTTIDSIKTDIGSIKTEIGLIKTAIDSIKAVLLVPNGVEEAKQATVVITVRNGNKDGGVLGHGTVVRAPDHDSRMGVKPKFYLLSAAHVLVGIANAMTDEKASNHLVLSWPHQTDDDVLSFVERQNGALILHKDYISNGSHDYGFMELKSFSQESCPFAMKTKRLSLRSPTVGESVVARGRVYLRGMVTSHVGTSPRFSVLVHSIPAGSSGAPIFSNDRQMVGVVHGSSKHRGHAKGNSDDDAAVVYADAIEVTKVLFEISDDHWNLLSMAEEVPPEVASGKKKLSRIETTKDESGEEEKVEVQTEGTKDLWELCAELKMDCKPMSKVTLENIMEALKEKVLIDKKPTRWEDANGFDLVFV